MIKKFILGIFAGIICGLFASGGGLILVPAFVYFFSLEEDKARATSLYSILPMVITSSFFYYKGDFIDWGIGIKVAIGGILGGIIGAKLLKKFSSNFLKITFSIFLMYMGITMINN